MFSGRLALNIPGLVGQAEPAEAGAESNTIIGMNLQGGRHLLEAAEVLGEIVRVVHVRSRLNALPVVIPQEP